MMMTQPPTKPAAPPLAKIQSSSHIPQLNVSLIYQGAPKSGKSTYALTWPDPFVFYFDKNMGVLREHPGVPFIQLDSWEEIEQRWLPAIANRRLTELVQAFTDDDGQKPYATYKVRTLVVDSFTNFLNMNYTQLEQAAPIGKNGEKDGYWIWREYFNRANRFINICTQASIPNPRRPQSETYHFVGTVHEKSEYDSTGVLLSTGPSVQGKLAEQFASYFDAVLLTECINGPSVEVPPAKPGAAPTKLRTKQYFIHAADYGVRRSAISGEFAKLPPKLNGDYATINEYLKLEGKES
jgi:hypothetical protein